MKLLSTLAAGIAMLLATPATAASLIGDFRLDGSTANAVASPLALTNNGGALGGTGIRFGQGQGPSITGFANLAAYSIEVAFSFDQLFGYRRILDFANKTSDQGLYNRSGFTSFFPVGTSAQADFATGVVRTLVLTRDMAGSTTAYVGGVPVLNFVDTPGQAIIGSALTFFNDDLVFSGEESPGFVDFIRIYDDPLTPEEVAELVPPSAIPEPATWAMLCVGFLVIVSAVRNRRRVPVVYS